MNIHLITTSPESASCYYRIAPFGYLMRTGVPGIKSITMSGRNNTQLFDLDPKQNIFIYHRPASPASHQHFTTALSHGFKTWVDFDDLLTQVPATNPAHAKTMANLGLVLEILEKASIVTVSTTELKTQWQRLNKNIHVIPNAHNDFQYNISKATFNATSARLMWRGSIYHTCDLMAYQQQFIEIAAQHPQHQLMFFGQNPGGMVLRQKNCVWQPEVWGFSTYMRAMQKMKPYLLLVPLAYHTFNLCKSNIAFLEATQCGAVCVGPPMPEWVLPGCMNYEKIELAEAIKSAAESPELCEVVHRMAKEYIAEKLLLSKVNTQRSQLIQSLI